MSLVGPSANHCKKNRDRHCQSNEKLPVAIEDEGRDQADEDAAERAANGDHQIKRGQVFGGGPQKIQLSMAKHADRE